MQLLDLIQTADGVVVRPVLERLEVTVAGAVAQHRDPQGDLDGAGLIGERDQEWLHHPEGVRVTLWAEMMIDPCAGTEIGTGTRRLFAQDVIHHRTALDLQFPSATVTLIGRDQGGPGHALVLARLVGAVLDTIRRCLKLLNYTFNCIKSIPWTPSLSCQAAFPIRMGCQPMWR